MELIWKTKIDVGTMLELPLWLAMPLLREGCVDLRVPRCFAQAVRNDIQAGPNQVDLNALSPYFYDFGTRFLSVYSLLLPKDRLYD